MCICIKECRVIIVICKEKCPNEVELVVSLYSALHFAQITLLRLHSPHVHLIHRCFDFVCFIANLKEAIKRRASYVNYYFLY